MKILAIAFLLLSLSLAQEVEDIVYEDEELEPLPTPPTPPPPSPEEIPGPEPIPPPQMRQPSLPPIKFDLATLKIYKNEVLAVLGIFLYLLMYIRGKRANVRLMERFYKKVANCLEANFCHVGFSKTSG